MSEGWVTEETPPVAPRSPDGADGARASATVHVRALADAGAESKLQLCGSAPPRCVTSLPSSKAPRAVSDPDRTGSPRLGPAPAPRTLNKLSRSRGNNPAVMTGGGGGAAAPPGGCKLSCKATKPESQLWIFPAFPGQQNCQQMKAALGPPPPQQWVEGEGGGGGRRRRQEQRWAQNCHPEKFPVDEEGRWRLNGPQIFC